MFVHSLALLALLASCQGRAVNISNTWVLPEEGFPVFYRYFRDRISWYEADAVCQFHHANLVTVDTTAQYDAVRAYLKELDISSAVWVGLIRSNPDGDFTWTDYRGLSGEGYWSAAPDARAAPLCAAADPAADYRWEARACGGPTVASFICELPVPQWALGNEGCMVRALPALTILYLPESAAVQLTADCGLAGVKKVQCTGNVKREDLLKELSCNEEEDTPSTLNPTSEETTWVTTDIVSNSTDFETTTETSVDDDVTASEHVDTNNQKITEATSTTVNAQTKQTPVLNKLSNIYTQKTINLDLIRDNNFQSNDIPKLAHNENFLSIEQSEKLEDEKHMHHKMLHDELAKHGNFETIFTQPTDHFVPPLVMAKAKISDDMTVLSLAEKHAQQLAEHRFSHVKVLDENKEHYFLNKNIVKSTTEEPNKFDIFEQPIVMTLQPITTKDELKKDKIKSSLPKKYKEKLEDPKSKYLKIDGKLMKFDKTTEKPTTSPDKSAAEVSTILVTESSKIKPDDYPMELTVILKEPTKDSNQSNGISINVNETTTSENEITESPVTAKTTYIDEITINPLQTKDLAISDGNSKLIKIPTSAPLSVLNTEKTFTETSSKIYVDAMKDVTVNHEIIKITIVNDDDKSSPTHVFEVTTLMPEFKDAEEDNKTVPFGIYIKDMISPDKTEDNTANVTAGHVTITPIVVVPPSTVHKSFAPTSSDFVTKYLPRLQSEQSNTETILTTENHGVTPIASTTPQPNKTVATAKPTNPSTTPNLFHTTKEKQEEPNVTETYEVLENNSTDSDAIDDLNSPLLSGANEPIHRPNRSRRPQPPNRLSKFNPFRILG